MDESFFQEFWINPCLSFGTPDRSILFTSERDRVTTFILHSADVRDGGANPLEKKKQLLFRRRTPADMPARMRLIYFLIVLQ